jgi:predicted porin
MKKSLLALAVTSAFAAPAFAQNSVTLYGIIDAGITYTNNSAGHGLWQAQSGIVQGSRWGLKGSEDLGGGTKAIFQLENGFNVFNGRLGQGSREFGRQAYVGLTNDTYGTLTLGRQYDSIVDMVQATTFNGQWGALFSHPSDIDNTDNGFRVNNAVKYVTPKWNGLQAEGMYAFGGVAGNFRQNSTLSTGLSYSAGPLYLGAAYFFARNPAAQFDDGNFVTNIGTAAAPVTPLAGTANGHGAFGYVGNPGSMETFGVGGSYAFGPATIGVNYSHVRFDNANQGAANLGGLRDAVWFQSAELWGQYSLTPATTLGLGYTYTDGKDNATGVKPKWHQVNAIADYRLSKRTDVYLMGIYQHASGGDAKADIYDGVSGAQSTTANQVAARVGIRHKF